MFHNQPHDMGYNEIMLHIILVGFVKYIGPAVSRAMIQAMLLNCTDWVTLWLWWMNQKRPPYDGCKSCSAYWYQGDMSKMVGSLRIWEYVT